MAPTSSAVASGYLTSSGADPPELTDLCILIIGGADTAMVWGLACVQTISDTIAIVTTIVQAC